MPEALLAVSVAQDVKASATLQSFLWKVRAGFGACAQGTGSTYIMRHMTH